MKRTNRKQIGQLCRTALGILCVGAVFCLALVFPGYYYEHYDKNTLNQVTYMDIQVNTYEVSYESFGEKLYAIARAFSEKKGLRAVRMDEIGIEMSQTDLTKIVNQELKKLNECNVMDRSIQFKKKHMILYERYILYGQNSEENFKGISIWKLVYENKKRKMTFYLDEEFQKMYYLEHVQKMPENESSGSYSKKNYSKEIYSQTDGYETRMSKFYNWWDGMIRYYDLSYQDNKLEFVSSDEDFTGEILFDGEYALFLYDLLSYDEDANQVWKMGLLMEKMIQF